MKKPLFTLLALLPLTGCGMDLYSVGLGPTLNDDVLHAEVFGVAYRQIDTYAIAPPPTSALANATLGGLEKLDPHISSAITPQGQWVLSRNGQLVASSLTPANGDYQRWGEQTLSLTEAAIKASPLLAKAKPEELYTPMLAGAAATLDTYSHYKSPTMTQHDAEWSTGYGGIGVTFERRGGNFAVLDVFINSPAAQAGLVAGDVITAVSGKAVEELSIEEFALQVRGPIGSPVTLTTTQRGNITIIRQKVIPTTVALRMEGTVAVIRISRFMPGTVEEFRKAARQAVWQKATAVVLDLQHNPGGYLESAVDIARLLAPRGPVLRMDGRHAASHEQYNTGGADILVGLPLLIVQDAFSASASEALAAGLRDRGRAILIGSTSFGKASVQNVVPLPHGGEMAITWARMVAPGGKTFFQAGVTPTLCLTPASTVAGAVEAARRGETDKPCIKTESLTKTALPVALALANDPTTLAALQAKVNDLAQSR